MPPDEPPEELLEVPLPLPLEEPLALPAGVSVEERPDHGDPVRMLSHWQRLLDAWEMGDVPGQDQGRPLRMLQVIALPFVFIPISTLNYVGVPATKTNQISSLSNFARNLGGSAGTALLTTYIARSAQVHQASLAANVIPGSSVSSATAGPHDHDRCERHGQ